MSSRRVGIAGCGEIARKHVRALAKLGCAPVAVCDRNIGLARVFAQRFPGAAVYDSLDAMLSESSLQSVHVTTPPLTHCELVVRSLQAGCDVLVEKPAALDVDELRRIEDASRRSGHRCTAVHNVLFEPPVRAARKSIEAGDIGEVVSVHITNRIRAHDKALLSPGHWCHDLPGGMFGEMLAHPMYTIAALLGQVEVRGVRAWKVGPGELSALDEMQIYLDADGGMASVAMSLNAVREEFRVDVLGTRGAIAADVTRGLITRYTREERSSTMRRGMANSREALSVLRQTSVAAMQKLAGRRPGGHDVLVADFYGSLDEERPSAVTLQDMREVTRLFEAVVRKLPPRG